MVSLKALDDFLLVNRVIFFNVEDMAQVSVEQAANRTRVPGKPAECPLVSLSHAPRSLRTQLAHDRFRTSWRVARLQARLGRRRSQSILTSRGRWCGILSKRSARRGGLFRESNVCKDEKALGTGKARRSAKRKMFQRSGHGCEDPFASPPFHDLCAQSQEHRPFCVRHCGVYNVHV